MKFSNNKGCIDTYSGKKYCFENPKTEQIDIIDIARGLAYRGHFGGQTKKFFSIAQHSLLVCDLLPSRYHNNYQMMMAALLHDASEAYTGDMVKPLKNLLPEFERIEDLATTIIFDTFKIDLKYLNKIKKYDVQAQEIEYDTFFNGKNKLQYLSPEEANKIFIIRFYDYLRLKDEHDTEKTPPICPKCKGMVKVSNDGYYCQNNCGYEMII